MFPVRRAGPSSSIALLLLLTGCGGGPPPPSPTPPAENRTSGPGKYCPPALQFDDTFVRPVRVRIENRTDRRLQVWLDRCFRTHFLAEVGPGKYRQPELPREIVGFPEGLRFRVYDTGSDGFFGLFTVPIGDEPIPRVVVSPQTRVSRDSLHAFRLPDHVESGEVGGFITGGTSSGRYAALKAEDGTAILMWACDSRSPNLTLSTPTKLSGDTAWVRMRREGGSWETAGRWPVQHGLSDALIVPEERHEEVTERFRGESSVEVEIEDRAGSTQVRRFPVAELDEALAELDCWPLFGD